ncbi:MAG: hypothetical protein AAGI11_21265 [Pseudomonadota bacterium]
MEPADPSLSGLAVALALPLILGAAFMYNLVGERRRPISLLLGFGYPLGVFFTSLSLRTWASLGATPAFWPLCSILVAVSIALFVLGRRRKAPVSFPASDVSTSFPIAVTRAEQLLLSVIVVLLAWRGFGLVSELVWRPLFAWDAWMNWSPRAIIWFELQEYVSVVNPQAWLEQGDSENLYTLGNKDASDYPKLVPGLIWWTMLGAGTSDSNLLYLPWALIWCSSGLALFGYLRALGIAFVWALISAYLLLSMPYLNVHAALAGYADIWVMAFYGLAILALSAYFAGAGSAWLVLALLMIVGCADTKRPGLVLAAMVFLLWLGAWLPIAVGYKVGVMLVTVVVILIGLAVGIDTELPGLGVVVLSFQEVSLPYLGSSTIEYRPGYLPMLDSMFNMSNWHLLWYLFIAVIVMECLRRRLASFLRFELVGTLALLIFLLAVYSLTDHYDNAISHVTLSRTLLYAVIPALAWIPVCLAGLNTGKEHD